MNPDLEGRLRIAPVSHFHWNYLELRARSVLEDRTIRCSGGHLGNVGAFPMKNDFHKGDEAVLELGIEGLERQVNFNSALRRLSSIFESNWKPSLWQRHLIS